VRILSYMLILLGIMVMAAPKLMEWHADREQNKLLMEAERLVVVESPHVETEVIASYERLSRLLKEENEQISEAEMLEGENERTGEVERLEDESEPPVGTELPRPTETAALSRAVVNHNEKLIATIQIDSIGLKLPILEGATQSNMKFAAAHMTETTPLGQIGNAAIAAHRARTKGRLFNRLDEVEIGDEIVIHASGEKYIYTVFRKTIVEPTDVSVLNHNDKDQILTLITCDPIVNATHRLIVQASL
jgi:sortase A